MARRVAKRRSGVAAQGAAETLPQRQPRKAKTQQQRPAQAVSAGDPRVGSARLPRVPKGGRARFFSESGVDQLFGIVTALTAELSVAFERIETLERVLESRGTLQRNEIESYVPGPLESASRTVDREALIERVFQVLEAYAEPNSPMPD